VRPTSRTKTTCSLAVFSALLIAATSACSSGHRSSAADKAGGSNAPTVLRLGSNDGIEQPDSPAVQYFAAQVAKLSGGRLRIKLIFEAGGDQVPNTEARIIRMVQEGKLDLGWVGARAWDGFAVKSFRALQAPFLITSYALLDRVSTSHLAAQMLAGLKSQRVVGLALVPDLLRHPFAWRRPLVSLADFREARIRDVPSRTSDALLKALGATPVHISNAASDSVRAHHGLDAEEGAFGIAPSGSIATANVTFFGKALTLFIGTGIFETLTNEQRSVLRAAAERTLRHVVASPPSESALARQFCAGGRIVLASKRDIAQLARAAQPVNATLERDPQTRAYIAEIRRLKEAIPPPPRLAVPTACRPRPTGAAATAQPHPRNILNGTYRWVLTETAARAFGPPAAGPGNVYPQVNTEVLNDGKWELSWAGGTPGIGTYKVVGNRVSFYDPRYGTTNTFTFTRDPDGTLHLRAVHPMDRGDEFLLIGGGPWRRVGPARKIP
jgi:TRAP-type C4-dicarboxylate transport system substrate-binding protein